jgi:integrase
MPRKILTDKAVLALKPAPAGTRYIVADAITPGLGVRVTDRGHKTYVLGARYPGSPHFKRREIGAVGAVSLASARETARAWITMIAGGRDPRDLVRKQRAEAAATAANTFSVVCEEYVARNLRGKRKATVVEREIRRELIPAWGNRPISEIGRRDVVQLIEAIIDRNPEGTGAYARNVFNHIRSVFAWAINRSVYGIEHSPVDRLKPKELVGAPRVRLRVLDDDELRALWRAAGRLRYPYGVLVRGLMLTGARLNELAGARQSEFDLAKKVWVVPAQRFKSDAQHIVPLTDAMIGWLETLPRWKAGDYLFSMDGRKPFNGFAKTKQRLDRQMSLSWRALGRVQGVERDALENWTHHDIRRSVRTRLSALRVPEHVAELVIGHAKRGLARVYNQHEFIDEMREALAAWNTLLAAIVSPPPPNVVALRDVS